MIGKANHYGSPLGLAPKRRRPFYPAGHFASQKPRETQRMLYGIITKNQTSKRCEKESTSSGAFSESCSPAARAAKTWRWKMALERRTEGKFP